MTPMAVGREVRKLVQFVDGQRVELVRDRVQMMYLKIEPSIACQLSLGTVSTALRASITVTLEHTLTKTLGVQPLPCVALVLLVCRNEPVVPWLQVSRIKVRLDRPPILVSQLADSSTSLFDSCHVIQIGSSNDFADVCFEQPPYAITRRAVVTPNRVEKLPPSGHPTVGVDRGQSVHPGFLVDRIAIFDAQLAYTPSPFADSRHGRQLVAVDPLSTVGLEVPEDLGPGPLTADRLRSSRTTISAGDSQVKRGERFQDALLVALGPDSAFKLDES